MNEFNTVLDPCPFSGYFHDSSTAGRCDDSALNTYNGLTWHGSSWNFHLHFCSVSVLYWDCCRWVWLQVRPRPHCIIPINVDIVIRPQFGCRWKQTVGDCATHLSYYMKGLIILLHNFPLILNICQVFALLHTLPPRTGPRNLSEQLYGWCCNDDAVAGPKTLDCF